MDAEQREIETKAAEIQAHYFKWFGGIARTILGKAFRMAEFLEYVGHIEINVIKCDTKVLAATTAGVDVTLVVPNEADRQRMVIAVQCQLDAAAEGIPDGVLAQIHKNLKVAWKKSTGRAIPQAFRAFSMGPEGSFSNADFDTNPVLFASNTPPLLPMLAPFGIERAGMGALDVLKPSKNLDGDITGLAATTLLESHSAGINITPYALVADSVESGK
jgi:hypothetical protein